MTKTTLLTAAFGIMLVGANFKAFAAPDTESLETYCSLKTLKGSYIYSIQGYREGKPYASSGLWSFDGAGKVAIIYTSSIERKQLTVTGTYTVDGNCTGSMTLATTTVNNFYLSPNGDSFNFVRVSGNDFIGTESRRVSRKLIIKHP